jgi:uncharacterized protein affecting Mg2+/Co2+ transport
LKQLVRDNFRAHSAATQQQQHQHQQRGESSSAQQELSPLDQGFAALRALPQQVYLEACSSSCVTDGVLIEATSCYNPRADPYASAGAVTGSSGSSSREQWFSYRIRVSNHRDHCIKVLGRGWVISSALGELEGYVKLAADNGIVGQQPVIPPGACFEYYSCSSLKRPTGPGTMKGHLLVSLLGPASQDEEQQQQQLTEDAAAAVDSEGNAAGAQQQEASSSSSSRRKAAAGEEVELERVAMPVGEFKLQSPATAAAAVEGARAVVNAGSSIAGNSADAAQEGAPQGGATAAAEAAAKHGTSSSRGAGSGSDSSSSSDDEGSRR